MSVLFFHMLTEVRRLLSTSGEKCQSLLNKSIKSQADVHAYGISVLVNALFLHILFINAHLRMK
jgi:hypothetical protein